VLLTAYIAYAKHYSFDPSPTDQLKRYITAVPRATEKAFLPMALLFIRKTPKEAPVLSSKHRKKV